MKQPTEEEVRIANAPVQSMSFERFKAELEKNLITLTDKEAAARLMTEYAEDLSKFYAEDWTIAGLTPGMIWHFL